MRPLFALALLTLASFAFAGTHCMTYEEKQ
jgi:hypothetical protein